MNRIFQKKKTFKINTTKKNQFVFDPMLDITLPSTFNQQLWNKISIAHPIIFIKNQEDIKNILLNDQQLFQSYFHIFYHNHQQLNNWYMLANSNQLELKLYIYHHLLSKSYKEYRKQIRQEKLIGQYNKTFEVFRNDQGEVKDRKYERLNKKPSSCHKFDALLKREDKQDDIRVSKHRQQLGFIDNVSRDETPQQDYHDLFLKTFSACDGSKYIYYNFNKHRKGMEDRGKYNDFIRVKKRKGGRTHRNDKPSESHGKQKMEKLVRSANISLHSKDQNDYFHEGESQMLDLKFCKYSLNPHGQISSQEYIQSLSLLKKKGGKLRKVNLNRKPNRFELKKMKVL